MHLFDILSALLLLDTSLSLTHLNLYSKINPKHASTRLLLSSIEENSDELGDDVFGASVGPLPSVSSRINFGETVVNYFAGTLGSIAAKKWKELFPSSRVLAETKTDRRHNELLQCGVEVRLRDQRLEDDDLSAKHLLICLPPSSSSNYADEINTACRLWAGPAGDGKLVFTSSTAVYGDSFGNIVNENFRLDTRSKRSTNLITAEDAILVREGSVLRLAGLYDETRGPHTYWLKNGTVQGSGDIYINMLHYEDAAAAAIAALLHGQLEQVYLACDDGPITRREICEAALQSGLFPQYQLPTFVQDAAGQPKICDGSVTREKIGWQPKHKNFGEYMVSTIGGKPFTLPDDAKRPGSKKNIEKKSALWLPGDDDLF